MADQDLTQFMDKAMRIGATQGSPKDLAVNTYAVVPSSYSIEDLTPIAEKHLPHPRQKKATVEMTDCGSFVRYFKAHFEDMRSVIFADSENRVFTAIFDYHGTGSESAAGWQRHKAKYQLSPTPEWAAWLTKDRIKMELRDFAEFLQENASDCVKPPAAAMIDIARGLNIKRSVNFSNGIELANGQVQLNYQESIEGTVAAGSVKFPEEFTINVAPYVGTQPRNVGAWLRYRLDGAKVTFYYELKRKEKVAEEAFLSALKTIEQDTNTMVYLGKVV